MSVFLYAVDKINIFFKSCSVLKNISIDIIVKTDESPALSLGIITFKTGTCIKCNDVSFCI